METEVLEAVETNQLLEKLQVDACLSLTQSVATGDVRFHYQAITHSNTFYLEKESAELVIDYLTKAFNLNA